MNNTIVVGGGIGGLALAAALRGVGVQPVVLERPRSSVRSVPAVRLPRWQETALAGELRREFGRR